MPRWIPLIILAAMLVGCQTLPQPPYPDTTNWIPDQSNLIVQIDVNGHRELTNILLSATKASTPELSHITKRMAHLTMGFELGPNQKTFNDIPIHIIAIGNWPKGMLGSVLGKDWTAIPEQKHAWNGPNNMAVFVPSKQQLLLSRGRLSAMQKNRVDEIRQTTRIWPEMPQNTDASILITSPDLVSRLIPIATGSVVSVSTALKKVANNAYDIDLTLYAGDTKFIKPLALALRIALSSRFGGSKSQPERDLFKRIKIKTEKTQVNVILPAVELPILKKIIQDLKLFEGDQV